MNSKRAPLRSDNCTQNPERCPNIFGIRVLIRRKNLYGALCRPSLFTWAVFECIDRDMNRTSGNRVEELGDGSNVYWPETNGVLPAGFPGLDCGPDSYHLPGGLHHDYRPSFQIESQLSETRAQCRSESYCEA